MKVHTTDHNKGKVSLGVVFLGAFIIIHYVVRIIRNIVHVLVWQKILDINTEN